jgi:hypothetical protein
MNNLSNTSIKLKWVQTITALTKDALYNLWVSIGLVRIVQSGVGKREFGTLEA